MADNKWSSFKIAGDFNTDVRTLYEAWATTAGLEKWFLRKADFYTIPRRVRDPEEFIMTEDTYEWYWHGWSDDAMEKGQVLEANGTDTIKFTFSGGSVVTVYIHSRNGVSIVDLTQENIPEEADLSKNLYVHCQLGWMFYLANLKSAIEGGVTLRNRRVDLPSHLK